MPWSVDNLPPSVERLNLTEEQKRDFVSVANDVLAETGDESSAIAIALFSIGKSSNIQLTGKNSSEESMDFTSKMEKKSIAFSVDEVREENDYGIFTGYASIFDNVDSYGDIVKKGSFLKSLEKRKPKFLWQHKVDEPIGIFEKVEEDDRGLYVRGRLALKTQEGARAYELLKMGAIDGLSIGFTIPEGGSEYSEHLGEKVKTLNSINLFEISLVTLPANELSLIDRVKAQNVSTSVKKDEENNDVAENTKSENKGKNIESFTCMKDFETFLKNPQPLSSSERKVFISKLKEFSKNRDGDDEEIKKQQRDAEIELVKKSFDAFINKLKEENNV